MRRRDVSTTMLAIAAGVAVLPRTASAQGCVLPCYPQSAAEMSVGVTPTNTQWLPADIRRYGTNTTPGTTDMTSALTAANTVSAAGGGDIVIAELIRLTSNVIISAGSTLRFEQGGGITVDSARTLTINGKVNAVRTLIFTGSGSVVYGSYLSSREAVAYPEWFGAVHDNSADDRNAIQSAVTMVAAAFGAVSLSTGYYRVRSTVVVGSRVRIYGVNRIATVISFDPTANDDSLFENGATDNCEFEHFGITGAGTATGKRGFTIDSSASAFTWRHMDFASLNDWCITIDSGQHCYIEDCRFGATHNATDTAIAVRSTTFLNRISVNNNRFYNNDRDIVFGGSSSAVSICENGFELTGSLLSVPQLSVNLQAASGFKIDNNYFEGVRTDPTKGVIELENSYSGSVDCNHMVGDSLGTTRSSIFVNCVGTTRGVRVNNNTFNEVLYYFIKSTASFVVEAHGNRYFDGGVQLATYQAVVPLMNGMANIDLDLPVTFTYDPPNIANGAGSTSSGQAMTGATFGDTIRVAAPYDQQGLTATAYVSAANTAVVRLENQTGGAINLGSGTWKLYRRAGNL